MHKTLLRAALVGSLSVAAAALTLPAGADPAPSSTDVVGVGSDVVQYAVDFAADGDVNGDPGYNAAGNINRLVNFDATADSNGRNAYVPGTTTLLNPTIQLRAGTTPVQRPNGGGAGVTALVNDGANGVSAGRISFARTPNLPTAAQQTAAQNNLGTQLHVVQIADDSQVIATAPTTNAPAGLSVAELVNIYNGTYKVWGDVPGYTGSAASQTIIPLIPQVGAGVRTTFTNALKAANNNQAVTLSTSVVNVQQNDPTAITTLSAADQKNAILPFPKSRLALYNAGFFHDPNAAYNASSAASVQSAGIALLSGNAPDGKASFSTPLPYYVVFRQSDATSTTPWQPGSTLNWVKALFSNPSGAKPFFATTPGQTLIAASGATPDYNDLGVVSSG